MKKYSKENQEIIENLKYDKNGLIPAIIQDEQTKDILIVAYMYKESLGITLKEMRT